MKKILKWSKWILLTALTLILIVIIPIGATKLYESIRASTLSDQEKRLEDLARLEYVMQNEFSGYAVLGKKDAFDNQLASLRGQVQENELSQEAFNLEVIKAVATFKDPHTVVYNFRELFTEYFPYRVEWYENDFYLVSGNVEEKWLGAKVSHFEGLDGSSVFDKLSQYTYSPNRTGNARFMSFYQAVPAVFHQEGIIPDPNRITLTVVDENGASAQLDFEKMPQSQIDTLSTYTSLAKKYKGEDQPLWKTNRERNYWYQYLPEEDVFYLRYTSCVAQGDIEAFWREMFEKVEEVNPGKFVLDIRGNPGGDSQNNGSLVQGISNNPALNQPGRLFTLIDRGTGSAAVSLAGEMEMRTAAILVGEKTMDKPNTTSDPTFFTLPHSGVTLVVPNLYSLHSHIHDQRDAVIPTIAIDQNIRGRNYLQDQVLDSILRMDGMDRIDQLNFAQLPEIVAGIYSFSPIRHLRLIPKDSVWMLSIDGLFDTPVYEKDATFFTQKYNIRITLNDPLGKSITLAMHDNEFTVSKIGNEEKSIVHNIYSGNTDQVNEALAALMEKEGLPYYLDRPFFQAKTYEVFKKEGFEKAYALNQVTKGLFPDDPVISIIDYELYEYDGNTIGKIKSVFPVVGKLLKRYYRIITTDKIINDDYNAFIGK